MRALLLTLLLTGCATSQTNPVRSFSIDLMDVAVLVQILEDGRCEATIGYDEGWTCKEAEK